MSYRAWDVCQGHLAGKVAVATKMAVVTTSWIPTVASSIVPGTWSSREAGVSNVQGAVREKWMEGCSNKWSASCR